MYLAHELMNDYLLYKIYLSMLLNDKQASLMNSVGEGSPTQSLTWLRSCLFWISQAMGCVAFS